MYFGGRISHYFKMQFTVTLFICSQIPIPFTVLFCTPASFLPVSVLYSVHEFVFQMKTLPPFPFVAHHCFDVQGLSFGCGACLRSHICCIACICFGICDITSFMVLGISVAAGVTHPVSTTEPHSRACSFGVLFRYRYSCLLYVYQGFINLFHLQPLSAREFVYVLGCIIQ